ncbi:hypothetical protein T440DRAFT_518886 [Plenodomus tracheiphilus IPT5]|uniref:Uncharacterized protein n=1 Tax=Plenodomus tracheiphilus IPT5 TaxID=1408161 RepID=A0A6A7B5B6_9PLEO|nr:hypothetical protein T440DRAFT_518886 [Plenodomus tracheiphilus IPT5]
MDPSSPRYEWPTEETLESPSPNQELRIGESRSPTDNGSPFQDLSLLRTKDILHYGQNKDYTFASRTHSLYWSHTQDQYSITIPQATIQGRQPHPVHSSPCPSSHNGITNAWRQEWDTHPRDPLPCRATEMMFLTRPKSFSRPQKSAPEWGYQSNSDTGPDPTGSRSQTSQREVAKKRRRISEGEENTAHDAAKAQVPQAIRAYGVIDLTATHIPLHDVLRALEVAYNTGYDDGRMMRTPCHESDDDPSKEPQGYGDVGNRRDSHP